MTENTLWQWGINLILQMQSYTGWRTAMQAMSFLGSTEFLLLILPALYWLVNRRLGVRAATLLLISIALGTLLKLMLHGPRPYWIDVRVQLLTSAEPTFGLPSIHAMNAVVMWGLLAHSLARWWAWLFALLLIAAVGIARIYLGVHFPSDIIAGWLIGLLLLAAWWLYAQPIARWFQRQASAQQRIIGFYVAVGLFLLGAVVRLLTLMRWEPTASWVNRWPQHVDQLFLAFSLGDLIIAAAVFAGMTSGFVLCQRQGGFATRGTLLQWLGRYLIGVVGVLLLWRGLDWLFAHLAPDESNLGYALRFVRYGLIGFWIFGLTPLVFVKLRLAEQEFAIDTIPRV